MYAGTRIGNIRIGIGNDPTFAEAPDFQPADAFVDNVIAMGAPLGAPCMSLSQDDVINGADLAMLLSNWHSDPNQPIWDSPADVNGDGQVNGADLALVLANWGPCAE